MALHRCDEDTAFRFFVDPLVVSSKIRSLYVIGKYSLEAVTGGKKVAGTFSNPKVASFWDTYGATLDRYTKAQARSPKEAATTKHELRSWLLSTVQSYPCLSEGAQQYVMVFGLRSVTYCCFGSLLTTMFFWYLFSPERTRKVIMIIIYISQRAWRPSNHVK
jgi:hypothetical protein